MKSHQNQFLKGQKLYDIIWNAMSRSDFLPQIKLIASLLTAQILKLMTVFSRNMKLWKLGIESKIMFLSKDKISKNFED